MPDKYPNFAALAAAEPATAYSILVRSMGSPVVVAAPHGGAIEPGPSEIALAIAAADLSCYLFEGRKSDGNHDLHLTSARFDEPQGLALLSAGRMVVTVHGEDSDGECVYLGGRHTAAVASVRAVLEPRGYRVQVHANPQLQGLQSRNICNLGLKGAGVQMELSLGLRETFFQSLTRSGRKQPTPRLAQFGALVRQGVLQMRL